MNRFKSIAFISGLVALACVSPSCLDENDDNVALYRPTALVTVRPASDGSFSMQLDDVTTLLPANVKTSPFGAKEVRALVNYNDNGETGSVRAVHINWMDSIRTKNAVPSLGDENDLRYGKDPIEVVRDWVTVAEDGYHHAFRPMRIHHSQTFHRQCWHTPCKDRHGNDCQVFLLDMGQLDVSGLDAQVCHNTLFAHAMA